MNARLSWYLPLISSVAGTRWGGAQKLGAWSWEMWEGKGCLFTEGFWAGIHEIVHQIAVVTYSFDRVYVSCIILRCLNCFRWYQFWDTLITIWLFICFWSNSYCQFLMRVEIGMAQWCIMSLCKKFHTHCQDQHCHNPCMHYREDKWIYGRALSMPTFLKVACKIL